MPVRTIDDKPSDTLVVVPGEGFWTGSSTLPHLHQIPDFTLIASLIGLADGEPLATARGLHNGRTRTLGAVL
jgi:hypothetical protein